MQEWVICFSLVKYQTQSVQPRASGCPGNMGSGVWEGDISPLNSELGTDVCSHLWPWEGALVDAFPAGADWVPGGDPLLRSQRISWPAPMALGTYSQRENSPNLPRLKVFFSSSLGEYKSSLRVCSDPNYAVCCHLPSIRRHATSASHAAPPEPCPTPGAPPLRLGGI